MELFHILRNFYRLEEEKEKTALKLVSKISSSFVVLENGQDSSQICV